MLNEFREHWCYGNWLHWHYLLFQWCSLNGNSQNGKMWPYCSIFILRRTSDALRDRHIRKWITLIWITRQRSDSLRPDAVLGNLLAVGCQAKVKNSDMHHFSPKTLKAEVSQRDYYMWYDSECLCQFEGTLCHHFSVQKLLVSSFGMQITQKLYWCKYKCV